MLAFTGDRSTMARFDGDIRAFPFRVLKPHPEVLIIGSAGGHEVLASLYFDARHVTGIELDQSLAVEAEQQLDRVLATDCLSGLEQLQREQLKFDLILFSCSAWNIRWLWLMFTVVSASP